MSFTMKKKPDEQAYLRPGEYIQNKGDVWAQWKCPKCGFLTNLTKQNHDVTYLGDVKPIASCPHKIGSGKKCDFSADVILEDWVPEALGSA